MDISKIPQNVLHCIHKRGHSDHDIEKMTPEEAFREFCEWNGLINWSDTLFRSVEALKSAASQA